jgi:hypothetical protein
MGRQKPFYFSGRGRGATGIFKQLYCFIEEGIACKRDTVWSGSRGIRRIWKKTGELNHAGRHSGCRPAGAKGNVDASSQSAGTGSETSAGLTFQKNFQYRNTDRV